MFGSPIPILKDKAGMAMHICNPGGGAFEGCGISHKLVIRHIPVFPAVCLALSCSEQNREWQHQEDEKRSQVLRHSVGMSGALWDTIL